MIKKIGSALLAVVLINVVAHAQSACYEFYGEARGTPVANANGPALCAQVASIEIAWRNSGANPSSANYTFVLGSSLSSNPGDADSSGAGTFCSARGDVVPKTPDAEAYCASNDCTDVQFYDNPYEWRNLAECPGDCEDKANDRFQAQALDVSDAFTPPETGCFGGCAAFLNARQPWTRLGPSGSRYWLAQYQYTGQECTSEVVVEDVEETTGPEQCTTVGPIEYCRGPSTGQGCGFVNDQYVCLPMAPDRTRCFEGVDGTMICAEGTPTPPAPDSGTPGQVAAPDTQITQNVTSNGSTTTTTYNVYSNTTVGNSSRDPGGDADGDGNGPGEGTCEGDDCDEEDGGGGDLQKPELDEGVPTIGESTETFYDAIRNGPLSTAVSGAGFSTGGGECPIASFPGLTSGTLTIDFHCELIDNNAALLAAVFYFMWTIAAVKVFLSA